MIRRRLEIEDWVVDFLFAEREYDVDGILGCMYDAGAPESKIEKALDLMDSCKYNCGFNFTNSFQRRGVVLFGPVDSAPQFLNTFVHEMRHLTDAMASYYDLESEPAAYLSGDVAMMLADTVFQLGCKKCR